MITFLLWNKESTLPIIYAEHVIFWQELGSNYWARDVYFISLSVSNRVFGRETPLYKFKYSCIKTDAVFMLFLVKRKETMKKRSLFTSLVTQVLFFSFLESRAERDYYWMQSELLYWSINNSKSAIPLVTSASLADPVPGALGQPGTQVQLSSCSARTNNKLGFRIAGGMVNECAPIDFEVTYFLLPKTRCQRSLETSGQPGSANLAVPVFDSTGVWGLQGKPGETIAVLPGPLFGQPGFFGHFDLCGATKLQGAECNAIFHLCNNACASIATSVGFGWMQFLESMIFAGQTHTDSNAHIPSDFFNFTDQLTAKNNFYGLLCGLRAEQTYDAWRFEEIIQAGVGLMKNNISIRGASKTASGNLFFLTADTSEDLLIGGIFTQPSNIGCYHQYACGGMVETIIRGLYCVRDTIELSLGYNFIVLSRIARATDQIDRIINSTRTSLADVSRATVGIGPGPVPFGMPAAAPLAYGAQEPVFCLKTKNFWAQGLIAGLKVRF